MAGHTKLQTHIEMKAFRLASELTMEEPCKEERVPFPLFKPLTQKKESTWIISLFVILHLGAFIATMIVNDCWHNSHRECALKSLGRFSFQPLSENPLLGPSASALDETGALRRGLLTDDNHLWRVFTSPLLHAGLFHLIINLSFVIFVGIHLEQEFGPLRTGVIYIFSAITGSLVAALFIQDRPSVSSSGALLGLLGTLLSALIRNWKVYTNKFAGLISVMMILMINLVLGLVPYIDNFSNMGGFISGFLLGFVLLSKPPLDKLAQNKGGLFDFDAKHMVKQSKKLDKPVQRGVSLIILILLVAGATTAVLHSINVNNYCSWCHYFDCIPSKWWSCADNTFQSDLGTASQYSPPYTPTACFGSDATQFPSSNFFAAAGEGIWDDGAACGRQYLINCINSVLPRACKHGETIQIKIVDRALTALSRPTREGTTMVLSSAALAAISDPNAPSLNIDFRQV